MQGQVTLTRRIHFSVANKGRRQIQTGPQPARDVPDGRVPRIARLMALAIKFDQMLASGDVRDQAELADLGHVTRARMTQIMNLLYLAPDIQEDILFLPYVRQGNDPVTERDVRPIAALPEWSCQRPLWTRLLGHANACAYNDL